MKPRWKLLVELTLFLTFTLVGGALVARSLFELQSNTADAFTVFWLVVGAICIWSWGDKVRDAWEEL